MVKDYHISTPFFEFGPKAYLYGEELLELMKKSTNWRRNTIWMCWRIFKRPICG